MTRIPLRSCWKILMNERSLKSIQKEGPLSNSSFFLSLNDAYEGNAV